MKKLFLSILILISSWAYAGTPEQVYTQNVLQGLNTVMSPDDIPANNTPDCLNGYFDIVLGGFAKRQGTVKSNLLPFTGNLWVRNVYDYKKVNGDEYIVANTSASVVISLGNGTYNTILSGQNPTNAFDFTTANNYLYGVNGYVAFKSSGTSAQLLTVSNSTGIPTNARYVKYIGNRMWYAGMPNTPGQIDFSNLQDPDNIPQLNYLIINASDGDIITGIFGFGGDVLVTKQKSTWQITENAPGQFSVKPLSQNVGCLYENTMQTYLNYPMWMSRRGVELYDGQFENISNVIDPNMKRLLQLSTQESLLSQGFFADWHAGTNVNTDLYTYPNSVAVSDINNDFLFINSDTFNNISLDSNSNLIATPDSLSGNYVNTYTTLDSNGDSNIAKMIDGDPSTYGTITTNNYAGIQTTRKKSPVAI